MILYFTNRSMEIVGVASTIGNKGLSVSDDLKTESVEDGAVTFECTIDFDNDKRDEAEKIAKPGNFILIDKGNKDWHVFTLITSNLDTKLRQIEMYAEDGGLDLLNEVNNGFQGTGSISTLITSAILYDTGWEIGIDEFVNSVSKSITLQAGETNVSALLSIASAFDAEIDYSFNITDGKIKNKYINIYKKRGDSNTATLTLNNEVDNITIKKSIEDIATGYRATGGIPENAKDPINLNGYSYDDGDFYVKGNKILSRTALQKWTRYFSENGSGDEGHILKNFTCDALTQADLVSQAIASLKKIYDMSVQYEIDISRLPDNVKVGDTINIIDEENRLYVNSRVLKLETSETNHTHTATLGEYVTKSYDISSRMLELSKNFQNESIKQREYTYKVQQLAKSAEEKATSANTMAINASSKADDAKHDATEAITKSTEAINKSAEAITESKQANQSAGEAKTSAETALTKIDSATADLKKAQDNINSLRSDISSTNKSLDELAKEAGETKETLDGLNGDLQETKETLELSYAKKTDLSSTEASLKAEITKSATELSSSIERTYVGKSELTDIQGKLQSQITQNAEGLTSQSSKIDKLENDTADAQLKITAASEAALKAQGIANEAQTAANNAKTAADEAQTAADEAASKATFAQQKANEAKTTAEAANTRLASAENDLSAAKENLKNVTADVNATKEQVEAAQNAVTEAEKNVAKAMKDATDAQNVAKTAQSAADTAKTTANTAQDTANKAKTNADEATKTANLAKETANKAQETVAGLTKRVTSAETNISQNSEAISSSASKITEIGNKLTNNYYSKTETDALLKVESDRVTTTVSRVETVEKKSLTSTVEEFYQSNSPTTLTGGTWSTTQPAWAQGKYIWRRFLITKGDGSTSYSPSATGICISGNTGATGAKGDKGDKGRGIASTVVTYQAWKDGTTTPTGTWSTTPPTTTADKPYLWTKTVITYTDGTSSTGYSVGSTPEGITVGGRNLLKGTHDTEQTYTRPSASSYSDPWAVMSTVELNSDTYTLSFWAKSSVAGDKITVYFHSPNTVTSSISSEGITSTRNDGMCNFTLSTKMTKYWVTYKMPKNSGSSKAIILPRLYAAGSGSGTVSVKWEKLEEGNKATDWTPAPEDVANDISAVDTKVTAVSTKATQLADKFNWLVKSGTSATDFTLTDRTATLISQYINLNGLVTFNGLNSDTQSKINNATNVANNAVNRLDANDKKLAARFNHRSDSKTEYIEIGKTNAKYYSDANKGNLHVWGTIGGWTSDNTGAVDIQFPVRASSIDAMNKSIVVQQKNTKISTNCCDLWIICDENNVLHYYIVGNSYYGYSLNLEWTGASFSRSNPKNISITIPDGTVVWKLSEQKATITKVEEGLTSVESTIGNWCSANDKTMINGGKIYTGSVTADKIAANAITADKIAVDAIKSKNYVAGSAGSFLNLQDGSFDSKYLKWTNTGAMTATSGTIGGITINDNGLSSSGTTSSGTTAKIELTRAGTITSKDIYSDGSYKNLSLNAYSFGLSQISPEGRVIRNVSFDLYGMYIDNDNGNGYLRIDSSGFHFHVDSTSLFYFDESIYVNGYKAMTSDDLAIITGTTANGTGIRIYFSYPTGFNQTNCWIEQLMVYSSNGSWHTGQSVNIYACLESGNIGIHTQSSSNQKSRPFKLILHKYY